jgi:ArsR family transcriptional regulator
MSLTPDTLAVRPLTGLMRALADDTRLRMVALLARGELCVCHLCSALDISQPNASQHLAVLRNGGVVECERRGSWVYYRLAEQGDPARTRVLAAVTASFAGVDTVAEDARRLVATKPAVTCG